MDQDIFKFTKKNIYRKKLVNLTKKINKSWGCDFS